MDMHSLKTKDEMNTQNFVLAGTPTVRTGSRQLLASSLKKKIKLHFNAWLRGLGLGIPLGSSRRRKTSSKDCKLG